MESVTTDKPDASRASDDEHLDHHRLQTVSALSTAILASGAIRGVCV